MAVVYPVILSKEANGYFVTIPDFDANTEGETLEEAIFMARDAIGILGIEMEDEGEQLPKPFSRTCEKELGDQEALIDIDFEDYRKKHDNRTVKKNCTIPYYLNAQAEKAGINFSRLLQDALKRELSC
ncbi:HicB family protein [Roseburia sp. AM51-8]|jgi:predicted RNase H-like HicB family nuclease|uniref:type II toxin-antitoxin system HicB family antitoxin n=1 Tax=Roseburia sp. AM51-8 TaxID=2292366 RepID=UPI000E471074|nr:type II toxin-antitoxin system HicB family antitoxin [Roseburia sp. AM51-8]RHP98991.1 HicB family protein [Roseburia sp. AM51-8]